MSYLTKHKEIIILHEILCLAVTYIFLNITPCIKEKSEVYCQNMPPK